MNSNQNFLQSSMKNFRGIKRLGDKALDQLSWQDMNICPIQDENSIAVIINHLRGNMLSRWTEFLTTDGEKPWRERDLEFEEPEINSREELMDLWEEGWACVFSALENLQEDELMNIVLIRNQKHTVIEAVQRQLQHYAYHVGQIVLLAKWHRGEEWKTLSIARGKSKQYKPTSEGVGEPESN